MKRLIAIVALAGIAWGKDAPTFNRDVAPLIFASCSECHHSERLAKQNLDKARAKLKK